MKIKNFKGQTNITGDRIAQARKELGLTQKELAEGMQSRGIELEHDAISRIELGIRFVADYELLILSDLLGRDLDWFLM